MVISTASMHFSSEQPVLQLAGVALDRAADAGQVAGVERLQHQHEGVSLVALDRVANLVLNVVGHHVDREAHSIHSVILAEGHRPLAI